MTLLTRTEIRALQAIDTNAVVDLLIELLEIPSVSGTDAEVDIQHVLAKKFATRDIDTDLWKLDLADLTTQPGFPGVESVRREAYGLVGTLGGQGEPALILQGHVDVVPAGRISNWATGPFTPTHHQGRVSARGTCDMKAGVAANIAAVAAVQAAGIKLVEPVALHLVAGEEDGGLGAFATLQRGHTGRACIITEPTSGTLITANAGALTFTIEVPGLATHASTTYAGHSAIDCYMAIHQELHDLQQRRNQTVEEPMTEYPIPYPISVGKIRAGDWSSSVPDLLIAEGRMGIRIQEDLDDAKAELEDAISTAAARDPFMASHQPSVRWSGGQFAGGRLPPGHPLRDLVGVAHADATGTVPPRERGAPYGSDLRLYAADGIPTLHYGPGDVRLAHGPNESVLISEMITVTEALVLSILRSCGAAN